MAQSHFASVERRLLCDLLDAVGPDQPTLCQGWRTRDLAAHLLLRERRPLAAAGIVVPALAGRTARVQRSLAQRPFAELVQWLRSPPWWVRPAAVADAVNGMEFFIHHEDVRRAQPQWQPRAGSALPQALWRRAAGMAKLRMRRFPAAVTLDCPGYGTVKVGRGGEPVSLVGPPGELLLFLSGRQPVAMVSLEGPDELTDRLAQASLQL